MRLYSKSRGALGVVAAVVVMRPDMGSQQCGCRDDRKGLLDSTANMIGLDLVLLRNRRKEGRVSTRSR